MSITFEKVDKKLRDELRRGSSPGANDELYKTLSEGETLWSEETDANKFASLYESARKRGYQMHLRKVEREVDGKSTIGTIFWWDPRPKDEPATA